LFGGISRQMKTLTGKDHLIVKKSVHGRAKRGVGSMTFRKWYEEIKDRSFTDLTPREKNCLESEFLEYLKMHVQDDPAAVFYNHLADPQSPSVA